MASESGPNSGLSAPAADTDAPTAVAASFRRLGGLLAIVAGFSFAINLLVLTAPLYMLQIYDRVLASRSAESLFFLTIVALFAIFLLGALDAVRAQIMTRVGARFDHQLAEQSFARVMRDGANVQPLRDLEMVRSFMTGPGTLALFDAPWTPLYIGFIYLMHPMLGNLALIGALALFALAIANDRATREPEGAGAAAARGANRFVETASRNREVIGAMGMLPALARRWRVRRDAGIGYQAQAGDRRALIAGAAKFFRLALQVGMLGLGAWLAIRQIITPGVMIAASIVMGRALAPVEQSIQGWRGFLQARGAYRRLEEVLGAASDPSPPTPLPAPKGRLDFENVFVRAPGRMQPVLRNISFTLQPGEALGVTGPSGAGKSSLARAIAGVWPPAAGTVRLDGAELANWDRAALGRHFGYLPQDIELFDGAVAQNIARFAEDDPRLAVEAAQFASAHDFILSLAEGYDAQIGPSGENLSGGQRQRIALARAVYGRPSLVVLDEPSSNLDPEGEGGLRETLARLRAAGATVVLISHHPSLFLSMDKLLVLKDGQIAEFGPRDAVMQKITRRVVRQPGAAMR